ncbi:ABC transporter permease [Marinobacter psychrophilus]|uniref:ABC transporter permease n=1 Tax=Marinobacter psychrophilus TaxID=330734 RepID=A0A0H4I3X5_9GAMM|nr:ABC transporter permease [Marinobacter psychrophilus]AKO52478.1 ABC transporter permease [Marinobacter psychrophilus]
MTRADMSDYSQPDQSAAGELLIDGDQISACGDWTLPYYHALYSSVTAVGQDSDRKRTLNLQTLGRIDTAGAALLAELVGPHNLEQWLADNPQAVSRETAALLSAVATAMTDQQPLPAPPGSTLSGLVRDIGAWVTELYQLVVTLVGFIGQIIAALAWTTLHPRRWRMTAFVAAVQDTGLNAVPIVALLTFLVGAVIAFLGATVLADFGATIYTVNLVAFSFLREFGVLLAAILLAGRTASSFTAQIGAMKVNEELDALRTLGLSPIEMLVLPRVLAMMVSLPLLTFVGMISGMVGGALVCAMTLDITPTQFVSIVSQDVALKHFLVGLSKAPIFAFLIAAVACLEGFKVSGSAQSVGVHTTSSVVQSIFMVILFDSIAALFFMEMGW